MRKIFNYLLLTLCGVVLFIGNAAATTVYDTFQDTTINWLNHDTGFTKDTIGDPKVHSMTVGIDDVTNFLVSVEIHVDNRLLFDNLFINVESNAATWEDWDYMITTAKYTNISTLYSVADNYEYTTVLSGGRNGHPMGIDTEDLTFKANMTNVVNYDYVNDLLTYDFTGLDIIMKENWVIGYTPFCANDVMLTPTPVPEPATMALLGIGLLGIAGISRRKRS